ncbi:hypothetical protein ABQF13_24050 [Mycolicibacterium sp. XJ879]
MKSLKALKALIAAVTLVTAATLIAPPAAAMMTWGNYDVLTNRYNRASWVWFITPCNPHKQPDCAAVSGISRLKFYYEYDGEAFLKDGRYTMTVDVPDGLQCPGHVMPTRDTYSWDEVSLAGTIDSVYDVGCFGGPPGSQFWTFALRRL